MASDRDVRYRQTSGTAKSQKNFYVYGNAVRQPEQAPKRAPQSRPEKEKSIDPQIRRNRNRELRMGFSYSLFLMSASVLAVLVCAAYIHFRSEVMARSDSVASLREQLTEMIEENNTAHNAIETSVNLQAIRDKAMGEMKMVPESQGTVIHYISPTSDYVRQYDDIPESGLLAASRESSK